MKLILEKDFGVIYNNEIISISVLIIKLSTTSSHRGFVRHHTLHLFNYFNGDYIDWTDLSEEHIVL